MNKYEVLVENSAEKDMYEIFRYIADNFQEMLSTFRKAIDSLEHFPFVNVLYNRRDMEYLFNEL